MIETVVRNGTLVTPHGCRQADVAIEDGRIIEVGRELPGGRDEVDASALLVFPGLIDVHVHFNEPGHEDWEGAATGSRALAATGGTLFFDMPLNSVPCTVNGAEFDRKRAALEASAVTDFALWGGLIPGSVANMAEMAARGVVGFKAFMANSGLPEFPYVDDMTLLDGLREAARLDMPVAVHAESEEITRALSEQITGRDVRAFLQSRPVAAELDAIQRALRLAQEAGARLHIVHVSCGRGVAMAADARSRGVDVSIETCPHYLFFTADDVERLGAIAKCAPPLRPAADQDALWEEVLSGQVDIVASDHSPATPAMKCGDFRSAWGGIAGGQSTLAVLLDRGHFRRGLPLQRIAKLLANEPARRFRIAAKGSLAAGFDADLVLVDPAASFTLASQDLLHRHQTSPYVSASFRGRVRRTIRRGETIFNEGTIAARTCGRLVRPGGVFFL